MAFCWVKWRRHRTSGDREIFLLRSSRKPGCNSASWEAVMSEFCLALLKSASLSGQVFMRHQEQILQSMISSFIYLFTFTDWGLWWLCKPPLQTILHTRQKMHKIRHCKSLSPSISGAPRSSTIRARRGTGLSCYMSSCSGFEYIESE